VQAPRGDRAYSEELFAHAARPRPRPAVPFLAGQRVARVEELWRIAVLGTWPPR